jgi:hypothetical protein
LQPLKKISARELLEMLRVAILLPRGVFILHLQVTVYTKVYNLTNEESLQK